MVHSYSISKFISLNYVELRKLAGSALRKNFDDDDVDELISNLVLDIVRLKILDKYPPEACKRYGVLLGTVLCRQFKHILFEERRRSACKCRDPHQALPEPPSSIKACEDRMYEVLAVREFLNRLNGPLRDLTDSRVQGYTGAECGKILGITKDAATKRNLRVRRAWVEYSAAQ